MKSNEPEITTQTSARRGFERALGIGVLLLVTLAGALAMSPSVADPDLWGHVQFGRDVLNSGEIAETTSYSFTAEGFRWINHENLSEIVMAFVVDNYGPGGLLWGKFLLSLFVIGSVVWFNMRQKVGLVPTSILALLVAWNLGYHWSFRPQISSFIMFTCMVMLLQFCFKGWRDQWHLPLKGWLNRSGDSEIRQTWIQGWMLWLLIPVILIWTNSHGGFVAGVCIAIAYLGLRAVEAIVDRGSDRWGLVRRLVLVGAAILAATLINPYSYRLPMWLMESLGSPRPEISDWSSSQLLSLVGFKFWILLLTAGFAIFMTKKNHDFVQTALLLITLWQALSHFRHVPFFTILCGFWLGPHLHSALNRVQKRSEYSGSETNAFSGVSFKARVVIACVMLLLIGGVTFRINDRLSQLKVDRSVYPVDAFEFVKENNINGRVVVTYNWAQYTIAAMCAPDLDPLNKSLVAFDGRYRTCYPQEVVDMHFDFLYGDQPVIGRYRSSNSPEKIDPTRVLEFGGPDLVLIKRFDEATSQHIGQLPDQWCLLYQDGLAQVWGLRSRFDDPASVDYLSEQDRRISENMPNGFAEWPALPKSRFATGTADSQDRIALVAKPN